MNNDIINEWLSEYEIQLQELAVKYNVPLGEVIEIAELYLLINFTYEEVIYYWDHLEWYGYNELQDEINTLFKYIREGPS